MTIKIRDLSIRYAVLFAVFVTLIIQPLQSLSSHFWRISPDTTLVDIIFEIVDIAWPIGLAVILGYGFIFRQKGIGSTLLAGIPLFAFYLTMLSVNILMSAADPSVKFRNFPNILAGILMLIGTGIREEVIFRGIIANSLALKYAKNTKGLWTAVTVSAVLFGAIHLTNTFHGVSLSGALVQTASGIGMGILFAAIYLRGGNIWMLAVLHALIDAFGLFDSTFLLNAVTEAQALSSLSFIAPLVSLPIQVIFAVVLLRKSKRPEIYERFSALQNGFANLNS